MARLIYLPDPDFCGTDSFMYHAWDGLSDSNQAMVTIQVVCVNDAPIATDDAYTVTQDSGPTAFDVLHNDVDPDGDVLSLLSVAVPSNGNGRYQWHNYSIHA